MIAGVIAVVAVVLSLAGSVNRLHRLFLRRENPPLRSLGLLAESQIVRNVAVWSSSLRSPPPSHLLLSSRSFGDLGVIVSAVAAVVLSLVGSDDYVLLSFLRCENPPPRFLD